MPAARDFKILARLYAEVFAQAQVRAYPPLPAARPAPAAQQAPKRRKVARRDEYSDESSEEDAEEDEPKKGRGSGRSSQKVTLCYRIKCIRIECLHQWAPSRAPRQRLCWPQSAGETAGLIKIHAPWHA